MKETTRRLAALWCLAAVWLWSGAAYAAAQDCKPWEEGCAFKAPEQVVSACGFGEVEAAPGRCCWRGQTWDDKALLCRGDAVCDAGGMELSGGACIPSTTWMVFHQQKCEAGYLGDCWRWARLAVPDIEEGGYALRGLPATAIGPVLRPLCARGIKEACAHLGAVLTAEDFVLRPADIPTLNAENQTPAYAEGLALLRSTCADGVADGCFALAETLLMRGGPMKRSGGPFEDREADAANERACALGHSAACYSVVGTAYYVEEQELPRRLSMKERACRGRPLARCTDPARAGERIRSHRLHAHTGRGIKTLADGEVLLRAQLKETHSGCLRGDLASCAYLDELERWEPAALDERQRALLIDPAARARVASLARDAGDEARWMRCRMGMVRDEDACDLAGLLAKKPKAKVAARAWALHDRLCDVVEGRGWRCANPLIAWRLLKQRSVLELVVDASRDILPRHLEHRRAALRDAAYERLTIITSDKVSRPPRHAAVARTVKGLRALCLGEPPRYSSCALAMRAALRSGDLKGYEALRARLPPVERRRGEMRLAPLTTSELEESRALARRHCERYGEHCAEYAAMIEVYKHMVERLPGPPPARPKSGTKEEAHTALRRGCAHLDEPACAALQRTPGGNPLRRARRERPQHQEALSGDRAAQLAAMARRCSFHTDVDQDSCQRLRRELRRQDDPAAVALLIKRCEQEPGWSREYVLDQPQRPCDMAQELLKERGDPRHDPLLFARCLMGDLLSCEAWLARQTPDAIAPLDDQAYAALRDACVGRASGPPCLALWSAWRAKRAPQLAADEGDKIGALACIGGMDPSTCSRIIERRMDEATAASRGDIAALLLLFAVSSRSHAELRDLYERGQLPAAVRELFIESVWGQCDGQATLSMRCGSVTGGARLLSSR